ncbi:hypothetical protein QN277_011667 [Acacia crassicarpa]|uniref:rRNA N-glycosylase n=1 Tax=Acacia crassicarpa TaxID=499986 RepID=A0AAE1TDR4_9FABA|nr:hypothetical protein QN277_011667 [Acacia crassicarpa]
MGVEFPLDPFNVETSHYVDYRDFIRNLRRRLGERTSHNLPALAICTNDPSRIRFFDLVLETNDHAVRFRLRMDNLYLIGYQMEDDRWFELGHRGDQHVITEPGTAFLGFGGNYDCLPADRTRVGFHSLVSAINQLAGTVNRQARERSVVVVIMMICESARFIPVFEYMASSFQHNPYTTTPWDTSVIHPWIMNLVTSWETLSALLLRADAYPHETIHDLGIIRRNNIRIPPNDTAITSIPAAIGVLGILLGLCFSPRGRRLVSRMASDDDEQRFSGIPLVHVFSAQINDLDGEDPGQLYGTITINNGFNTEYIYNRTSDNYESISPGQQVTLTGPSYSVPAFGSFTIKVLLTDYDTISSDDEIIDEEDLIPWYAADIKNEYDKLITSEVFSSIGSVTVKYAVFENAVAARVVVNLEEGGEVTTEVYGHVSARYDKQWEMEPTATCMLFNRASDDYAEVNRWQNIPLSRSLVAVPLNHSLKVTVELYDYDTSSADDLIANGTVDFPVPESLPAISTQDIYGEDGDRVKVSIHWSSGLSE